VWSNRSPQQILRRKIYNHGQIETAKSAKANASSR